MNCGMLCPAWSNTESVSSRRRGTKVLAVRGLLVTGCAPRFTTPPNCFPNQRMPSPTPRRKESMSEETIFTEDDILKQHVPFAKVTRASLPKVKSIEKPKDTKCKCGRRCWPYSSCQRCRGINALRPAMNYLEKEGVIVRLVDGRGRKGGRVYDLSPEEKERRAAEKAAKTYRREAPKVGRNDLCPCGSRRKFKACCMFKNCHRTPTKPENPTPCLKRTGVQPPP